LTNGTKRVYSLSTKAPREKSLGAFFFTTLREEDRMFNIFKKIFSTTTWEVAFGFVIGSGLKMLLNKALPVEWKI
jgi:hypothetical protein